MKVGLIHFRQAIIDDAPDLARILIGANEATFRGLVPDKCLTSLSHEESVANWRRTLSAGGLADGNFLIVCEYAVTEPAGVETGRRELVGYVLAGGKTELDAYERELNVLMVDTSWQRQGIGRRLVSHAATELQRQGIKSMLLAVQVDNPNRVFYERLGGRPVGRRPLDWEGYETEVILYGWDDISVLVEKET